MRKHYVALFAIVGCASAKNGTTDPDGGVVGSDADASCGELCDADHDGVVDGIDLCPGSSSLAEVNDDGCADSQLTSMLVPFPPFNLTWTPTGDLGRAGGLTWTYVGIERQDLFHIDWIVCDDPATPCGLSLDGPIDAPAEKWQFSPSSSEMSNGKLSYINSTHIVLDNATTPALAGRLTITIADGATPIACTDVATMQVTPRNGTHGAEITGTAFTVVALAEIQDPTTLAWRPYLDYYDAAPTPATSGSVVMSFGGSFYAK